uniref:L27 domain-containing protein n=1 Tax=Rhabditophanes sp. KR3021 TaxID=114890 RepID=A0AC35TW36_9BILA
MAIQQSGEAHRALELLEDYHARLSSSYDAPLKECIEKIIGSFKNELFQTLLEIQDLYDSTLLSSNKSSDQKLSEVRHFLGRWQPMNLRKPTAGIDSIFTSTATDFRDTSLTTGTDYFNNNSLLNNTTTLTGRNVPIHHTSNGYLDDEVNNYDYDHIALEKGQAGLGFSITGKFVDKENINFISK